jgi:hypothetical protein
VTEHRRDDLDQLLAREFSRVFETTTDDEFADRVMRRLRRRGRLRALTLFVALALGLGIAFVPLMQIAGAISGIAPVLADGWRIGELPGQSRYLVVAILMGLASPLLIRLLER